MSGYSGQISDDEHDAYDAQVLPIGLNVFNCDFHKTDAFVIFPDIPDLLVLCPQPPWRFDVYTFW